MNVVAWAAPGGEAPAYWPFHPVGRGAISCRDLGQPARSPRAMVLRTEAAFRAFWQVAHRTPDTYEPAGAPPPPPRIDFGDHIAVVVLGRAGSTHVKVQKMWTLPGNRLVAGLFNPIWPDVAMNPARVPYELVVAKSSSRTVTLFERPAAVALHALTRQALARVPPPTGGGGHPLDDVHVEALRQVCVVRGNMLLQALERLPRPRAGDPEEPYVHLLRGAILARLLDQAEEARKSFQRVITEWPGSIPARFAKSRLEALERRPRDLAARAYLGQCRQAMSAGSPPTEGHVRRWWELGQQYEYLTSLAPLSLYVAARCYIEAARGSDDADRVQNALLQAAALYAEQFDLGTATSLYWQCIRRYPDARSVPRTLEQLGEIGWEQHQPKAWQAACRAFLKRFPRSANAATVRKMLARAVAQGR